MLSWGLRTVERSKCRFISQLAFSLHPLKQTHSRRTGPQYILWEVLLAFLNVWLLLLVTALLLNKTGWPWGKQREPPQIAFLGSVGRTPLIGTAIADRAVWRSSPPGPQPSFWITNDMGSSTKLNLCFRRRGSKYRASVWHLAFLFTWVFPIQVSVGYIFQQNSPEIWGDANLPLSTTAFNNCLSISSSSALGVVVA